MAPSEEHKYLSKTTTEILSSLAKSRLYSYSEAERGRLDFSCILAETWRYLVAGQVLWKHEAFVDRDLRSLLAVDEAPLVVYVARHTMKTRAVLYAALADYKRGPLAVNLPRLKVFWIPPDFDADDESKRQAVEHQLRGDLANDVLLNVVLGRLNATDARRLARGGTSRLAGLELAMLARIETKPFISVNQLADDLSVSATTVKHRLERLLGTRLLGEVEEEWSYTVSPAGRALLRICAELFFCEVVDSLGLAIDPELSYILDLLEEEPIFARRDWVSRDVSLREVLWMHAKKAHSRWDVAWDLFRLSATDSELILPGQERA